MQLWTANEVLWSSETTSHGEFYSTNPAQQNRKCDSCRWNPTVSDARCSTDSWKAKTDGRKSSSGSGQHNKSIYFRLSQPILNIMRVSFSGLQTKRPNRMLAFGTATSMQFLNAHLFVKLFFHGTIEQM